MTDIFDNQDKIVQNMNESANKLGLEDVVKATKKKIVPMHKRSCKKCNGLGGFRHVTPNGKESIMRCSCVRLFQITVPADSE